MIFSWGIGPKFYLQECRMAGSKISGRETTRNEHLNSDLNSLFMEISFMFAFAVVSDNEIRDEGIRCFKDFPVQSRKCY